MALFEGNFFSETLGMCVQANVILPQRYQHGRASAPKDRYPVLYLLHGMTDDHTMWLRRTSIERYADAYQLAVVMPSTHLGWYTDMYIGNRYWTYFSEELPALCRDFFPGISGQREDTFAAGLSMGGYGAMKLGLRASERFSKVATLSAGFDTTGRLSNRHVDKTSDEHFWESVFGPKDQVAGSFNDLFAAAEDLKASDSMLPDIYMWCGTEDFIHNENVAMRDHLQSLGYPLHYEESPGDHQWKYWDQKIEEVLAWLNPPRAMGR